MDNSPMEAARAAQSSTHSPPRHHHHHQQSSGSNSFCSNGGVQIHSTTTPPLTPISRSDTNPYPTTFVQADTSTFKQVVQMLTGSSETAKQAHQDPTPTPPMTPRNNSSSSNFSIPPIRNIPKKQQQQNSNSFKLYERRNNNHKATLMINTLLPNLVNSSPAGFSPRNKQQEISSPSLLDFPKLTLSSPVTPLNDYDPFNRSSSSSSSSQEDRAIAEKGFFLHPSPMSTPRDSEPQLLSLFPVTSPRILGSSTS